MGFRSLKKFQGVVKHFEDFVEDQFDFHGYCIRKTTLRCVNNSVNKNTLASTSILLMTQMRSSTLHLSHSLDSFSLPSGLMSPC